MEAKKRNIIHHRTMEKIMNVTFSNDSTKPLHNEIKEVVENGTLLFDDYMRLVYDHPKWFWN